ncbi:MAG: cyclic lactone autoinducer peptide [Clostridia bacterium]
MKKTWRILVVLGASLLTLVANASAASACWTMLYQPEVPKALREE